MNFLNKMERKIGKYAIPNLMIYLIAAYCIGFVIYTVNPNFMLMLTLSPYHILHGQVWRLITWILMPTDTRVFSLLIMALLYYQLGSALERSWGTFRFNVYIFGGMLFTVIGAFILYGIYAAAGTGNLETISLISSLTFTTNYINLTIFLAFAVMYPEMQILLFFIIPVKMKWMAVVYAVLIAINLILTSWGGRIAIIMSILNFLIFFLSTRNYRRVSPKEIHRKQVFKAQMREPRRGSMVTKHKCAVCGRTELDDPNLEFRFCSKCDGNYEYCQDHLFTHQHIKHS
jgi:hypothetical protein